MSDSDQRKRLAYAIRAAREERGLTPPRLAAALHKGASTINRWESGETVPSLLDLGPLCEALNVEPELFAYPPPVPPSPITPYLRPTPQDVETAVEKGAKRAVAEARTEPPAVEDPAGKRGGRSQAPRGQVPPPGR